MEILIRNWWIMQNFNKIRITLIFLNATGWQLTDNSVENETMTQIRTSEFGSMKNGNGGNINFAVGKHEKIIFYDFSC